MSKKIPISSIPELMEIWDWDLNEASPDDIGKRSDAKIWWKCPNGHESYLQSPRKKVSRKSGCPKCASETRVNKQLERMLEANGSICDTHPYLLDEWDYERNEIEPQSVLAGPHRKRWWICPTCGKSFEMAPNQRTSKGYGCFACGVAARAQAKRRNLIKKHGSLSESRPSLAAEWDYSLNSDTPEDVHKGMPDGRWWKCSQGHASYFQPIRDRIRRRSGCPVCHGENQTSFPEQAIYYYVSKYFPDAISRYAESSFELDVFIPSESVGIEYDGSYWHRCKAGKEKEKDAYYENDGIAVYRVKETRSENTRDGKQTMYI